MFSSSSRKDNELLKAKRLSKAALAAFACAFAWAGCTLNTNAPQPAHQLRTIELSFAQIQEVQPEEAPEVRPESLPQPVIEETKKLVIDESEFKVEPEKAVEEKQAETLTSPPIPVEQPKPKKAEPERQKPEAAEKPKLVKKPKDSKVEKKETVPHQAIESAEGKAASAAHAAAEQTAKKKSITAMLVSLIEKHKRYPKAARRAGMEGAVLVEFTVDASGKVTAASVIKKSGKGSLDSASQELSRRIIGTGFNVPNAGMKIQVPIRYSLD